MSANSGDYDPDQDEISNHLAAYEAATKKLLRDALDEITKMAQRTFAESSQSHQAGLETIESRLVKLELSVTGQAGVQAELARVHQDLSVLSRGVQRSNRALFELVDSKMARIEASIKGSSGALLESTDTLADSIRQSVKTALQGLDDRLGEETGRIEGAVKDSAAHVVDRMAGEIGRVQESVAQVGERLNETEDVVNETVAKTGESLTGRLLTEATRIRNLVQQTSGAFHEAVSHENLTFDRLLNETSAAIGQQVSAVGQQVSAVGSQVSAEARQIQKALEDSASGLQSELTEKMRELDQGVKDSGASSYQQRAAQSAQLQKSVESAQAELTGRLRESYEWIRAEISAAKDATNEATSGVMKEMAAAYVGALDQLNESTTSAVQYVSESSAQIEGIRKSLIRYLAERDRRLEQARSQVFVEMIERMSQNLGRRTRFKLGSALREAEDSLQGEHGGGLRPPAHEARDSYSGFGEVGDVAAPDFEQLLAGSGLPTKPPEPDPLGVSVIPSFDPRYEGDPVVVREQGDSQILQTEQIDSIDPLGPLIDDTEVPEESAHTPEGELGPSGQLPAKAEPVRRPRRPVPHQTADGSKKPAVSRAPKSSRPPETTMAPPKARVSKSTGKINKPKSQTKVRTKSTKR